MKICCLFLLLFVVSGLSAQSNRVLRGTVVYLNSGKQPAAGVQVSASSRDGGRATPVYSNAQGHFQLDFPNAAAGDLVSLEIGDALRDGQPIELVNQHEINLCRIPHQVKQDPFKVVVCQKGARDIAAQRYYNIMKASTDRVLRRKERQLQRMLSKQEKNYEKIASLQKELRKLHVELDTSQIYSEALRLASINKDYANSRTLEYLRRIEAGETIQEAREALSIEKASNQLSTGLEFFLSALEELETRAKASILIFDYEDASRCYIKIIEQVRKHEDRFKVDKINKYYAEIIYALSWAGQYEEALQYGLENARIQEKYQIDSLLITGYANTALCCSLMGNYEQSLKYYKKSIFILKKMHATPSVGLARFYSSVGSAYEALAQYKTALYYQKKAINMMKQLSVADNSESAALHNKIAVTYGDMGRDSLALVHLRKAIFIEKKLHNTVNPTLAIYYSNLGSLYANLKNYKDALLFEEKALNIRKDLLNLFHPDLAESYDGIAIIHHSLNNYEQAMKFFKKSIAISERILFPLHPDLVTSYSNIACLYSDLGQSDSAIYFHERALKICTKSSTFPQTILATVHNQAGNSYYDINNFYKAIYHYEHSILIKELIFFSTHHELLASYKNLSDAYEAVYEYRKLIPIVKKIINIEKQTLPSSHPDLAYSYHQLAMAYNGLSDYQQAVFFTKQSIHVLEKHSNPSKEKILTSYNNLIVLLIRVRNFREAYHFLNNATFQSNPKDIIHLHWAFYHAAQNNSNETLMHLKKAIDYGYKNAYEINQTKEFDFLRDDIEFKTLMNKI